MSTFFQRGSFFLWFSFLIFKSGENVWIFFSKSCFGCAGITLLAVFFIYGREKRVLYLVKGGKMIYLAISSVLDSEIIGGFVLVLHYHFFTGGEKI